MLKKSILIERKSSVTCKNLQLVIKNETREATIPKGRVKNNLIFLKSSNNLAQFQ